MDVQQTNLSRNARDRRNLHNAQAPYIWRAIVATGNTLPASATSQGVTVVRRLLHTAGAGFLSNTMKSYRENPESEESKRATRENDRYIGGLKLAANALMTKQTHMPGPWSIKDGQDVIATTGGDSLLIAQCHAGHAPERAANARLIAAAPQLLEALQGLIQFVDEGGPILPGAPLLNDARAALASATKETP